MDCKSFRIEGLGTENTREKDWKREKRESSLKKLQPKSGRAQGPWRRGLGRKAGFPVI